MQLFAVELTYLDKSRCTVQKRLSSRKTISSKRCRGGKGFVRRKSGRFAKLPMIERRSLPEAVADAEKNKYDNIIWLNPLPEMVWDKVFGAETLLIIKDIFPMYELSQIGRAHV